MKRVVFLSLLMLVALSLYASVYSSTEPTQLDNASADVKFTVGDSADYIAIAFTDKPCTSFDDDLKSMAKDQITMVFDSQGYAVTDKTYYISYVLVTKENLQVSLTASSKIGETETKSKKDFSYFVYTESGGQMISHTAGSSIDILTITNPSYYGVYGSEAMTLKSQNTIGSNNYGVTYYGWLNVEVKTVS